MDNYIKLLEDKNIGKILKNESLKKYNTYKVGGKAKLVVFPKNIDKLIELLKIIKENNIKYKLIGKGSNLIFSDKDYDGIIIKLDEFNNLEVNDEKIVVGAGFSLVTLSLKCADLGLSGLEFAAGIPGSVGGAVFMNAGAYKSDMSDVLSEIKVIDDKLNLITMTKDELNFGYRSSFLQKNKNYICVEATLIMKHGDIKEIKEKMNNRKQRRLDTQPLEYPSAGSVFRNPIDVPAGKLIEDAKLKGKKIGGAEVSMKHANFIINTGDAKATDVRDLINYVKDTVKKQTNIELKEEQEFVNWE